MKFKILYTISEILQIKGDWAELYDKSDELSVYQSVDWAVTWLEHYGKTHEIFFITGYNKEDKLIAVVPLVKKVVSEDNVLEFVGDPLNDYNNLIAFKNVDLKELVKDITIILNKSLSAGAYLHFNCINLRLQNILSADFSKTKCCVTQEQDDMAVVVPLPKTYDEYCYKIRTKLKRFNYYEKRLFNLGSVEFKFLTLEDDLDGFVEWFQENKFKCWKNFNVFDSILPELRENTFYDFLYDLIIKFLPQNKVIIPCIIHQGKIISSGIYFRSKREISAYMHAWDYDFRSYSPGTVLDWIMIRFAINHHYEIFDFGRGDEQYKYKFGGDNRCLYKLKIKVI